MEFSDIFKTIILHHGHALGSHPLQENGSILDPKFFKDRFQIDRMDIEHGERLGGADPYGENLSPIKVF